MSRRPGVFIYRRPRERARRYIPRGHRAHSGRLASAERALRDRRFTSSRALNWMMRVCTAVGERGIMMGYVVWGPGSRGEVGRARL